MIGDEEAKALQEVAKLGQKGLDVSREAGGFFSRTFGDTIEHLSAAMSDRAAGYRMVNRVRVAQKTERLLKELGVEEYKAIPFQNCVALLEGISDESDEELQDVWASYFANALNPDNHAVMANRQLIGIIRQLEPEDLTVISGISSRELNEGREAPLIKRQSDFSFGEDALDRSLPRLTALGLFSFDNGPTRLAVESGGIRPCRVVIETELGEFTATPLLMSLKNSIEDPRG
jgi:hypothetical protein